MNPCGVRPFHTRSRKRFKHEWQEHATISSEEFAVQKDEELKQGSFTKLEYFVIVNIYEYCDKEDIDPTTKNMSFIYHRIFASATEMDSHLTLRVLPEEAFSSFLQQHKKF